MITYHLWKKEIQIFAKVLRLNAPSHSNVSNTGLKSPVSKRSKNNKDNSSFFLPFDGRLTFIWSGETWMQISAVLNNFIQEAEKFYGGEVLYCNNLYLP